MILGIIFEVLEEIIESINELTHDSTILQTLPDPVFLYYHRSHRNGAEELLCS